MEIHNISGSDTVSTKFTVENPVNENAKPRQEEQEIKRTQPSTDSERGQIIDTYA